MSRLEEIKKRLVLLHNAIDVDDETKNYIFKDLKVEWLIERVEELEQENKQNKEAYQDRCDDIDGLLEHFNTSWEELIDE